MVLNRRNRLYGMCNANVFYAGFRESEVPDLSCLNKLPDSSCNIFHGHVRINAMLIEQINMICTQAPERSIHNLANMFRTAVQSDLALRMRIP